MKRSVLAFLFFVLSNYAFSDSRTDKIKALMEAEGILEMFEQSIESGKQQNEKVGQQILEQFFSQMNPSEKFKLKFREAFTKFMSSTAAPWTPEQIVDVWARYYGAGFTDSELDQLVAFYTSPLGKKDVKVTKETSIAFQNHFREAWQPIVESATKTYISELKSVAQECKCAK